MKECWQEPGAGWTSYGGFPRQMTAIASLFDEMDLIIIDTKPRAGGLPLPATAHVIALREPSGSDFRRKLSVIAQLPYYAGMIAKHVRRADVVHVPLPGDMPFLGMLVALVLGKPVLARYGGSWQATNQTTFMNRVTRTIMRIAARGRNVVIATGEGNTKPSPGMEWLFSTSLTQAEINGIRPVYDRGLAASPQLIYAGRLSSEKGVFELVQAMAILVKEKYMPLPSLVMAGDGPDRGALEKLAENLGCREQIQFVGQLNRAELTQAFLDADLAVQPSLTESFGKAWIDAMAHGVPVIAGDVGSARSCIGEQGTRGWYVEPGNANALAAAIRHAIGQPQDWPAMRRRCRAYAEQFTIESWRDRIAAMCCARWSYSMRQGRLTR
jgi:glycosyltransferase involved in cell wall biosynthesis